MSKKKTPTKSRKKNKATVKKAAATKSPEPAFTEITDPYQQALFLQAIGLQGPQGFNLPTGVKNVDIYTQPVPANWGATRIHKFLSDECEVDVKVGKAFLFFNKSKNKLTLYFKDSEGDQLLTKIVEKGGFIVPTSDPDRDFVKVSAKKLPSLFRSPSR